ncbi:DUF4367 domain-containing protein [Candidatus Saccharibacteria bacterium]|nr:DUF4367 domain-containing protein [Candidatus Saccharibacteria bacterium]
MDGFITNPKKTSTRKQIISSHVHQRTEKARTLMRGGLKRPAVKPHNSVRSSSAFNPQREIRAKSTPRHHEIKRFGIPTPHTKKSTRTTTAVSGELLNRPSTPVNSAPKTASAPLPSMITSASHQKLERLLDQALTHADSHKEAMRYNAAKHFWQRRWLGGRRKWLLLGFLVIAVIIGLLVSWQKVPQLSVKAAGFRAHLKSTVPSYKPDGFKMAGPARAVSGTVDIKYQSIADSSRFYNIIQAESNLTSSSVGQSVVPKGAPVQTSQVNGDTIYIYGRNNDAAWVNNGVLYTIKDHANLSSDELIKIVQGLNP